MKTIISALAAASLVGSAQAVCGLEAGQSGFPCLEAGSPYCAVSGEGTAISNPTMTHEVQVTFNKPVAIIANRALQIVTRDANGVLAVDPTITSSTTDDFRTYTFVLSSLKNGYSYSVSTLESVAYPCQESMDAGAGYKCSLPNPIAGVVPGGNRASLSTYKFVFTNDPLVGVITKTGAGLGDERDVVRFSIEWNRPAFPAGDLLEDTGGILAVDKDYNPLGGGSPRLKLRDVTYGTTTWSFSVQGSNGNRIIISLPTDGEAAYDARGVANNPTTKTLTVYVEYTQDCSIAIEWAEWQNHCTVDNCAGNEGTTYDQGKVRSVSPGGIVKVPAMYGGAACPDYVEVEFAPCTCPLNRDQCKDRCDGLSADETCSCAPACHDSPKGCCADVFESCPANLPECASPDPVTWTYPADSVECQEHARASDSSILCYCDQWCVAEGNCCKNYEQGCFEGLCQRKAIGNFCADDYVKDKYQGCQCDPQCISIGDCCRDFTSVCGGEPLCANPGNCNKMMGSSMDSWCMCDHECLEMRDCCRDYESKCEVQATCQYRKLVNGVEESGHRQPTRKETFDQKTSLDGNYPTDILAGINKNANYADNHLTSPIDKYIWYPVAVDEIPAYGCGSVRFTYNHAWCSCDDQCLFWKDCCPDYVARCVNTNW